LRIGALYLGCVCVAVLGSGVLGSGYAHASSFDGVWEWNAAPSTKTFSIELKQHGRIVQGQYCAVAQNGNRTDCDDEENLNIKGTIDRAGQSATVHFSSFFGAENGKAQIKIQNDHLFWHIKKNPDNGEFYAPSDAVLDRR